MKFVSYNKESVFAEVEDGFFVTDIKSYLQPRVTLYFILTRY